MKMSTIRFVIILAAVTTLSKADITSLEMKVEGLENLISSMQTFVLQDMILIKGKLANTDRKLEQLFDRIDNLQSTERVGGISEGDIEQISAKVVQQVSERIDLQNIGSGVSKGSAAKLEDLENKVNKTHNAVKEMGTEMATVSDILTRVKRGFAKEKLSLLNEVSALKETTANVKRAIDAIFVDFNNTMDSIEHKHNEITTKLKSDIGTLVTEVSDKIAEIVNNESLKATQLIQDTFNYFGKNGEQLSSEMSSVAINISSQLDDRVGEVVIRLDNISLECVKSIGRLNNHNEKMMFLHRFDGIGIKHFHVLGARARLANATLYDTNGVQGRLEVNVNGEWGTVCNVNFDTSANPYGEADEETVSCRTLGAGFTKGLALPNIPFGQSMGPVVMSQDCDGHEHSLHDCRDNGDPTFCGHERDVHLRCFE
ncbi:uncharacterized protein LOC128221081 [Mya arenaria]|uniref:uncharacterized protein LOC128221081 n=1 Tax=Mya arenaria TaxID=6604 RepID=UPI0022E08DA3|nr:uncharacterized protein LOC128221081 [Mya arenaria]XP_052785485.1 uncharacterized protein LOC128221081 [Mya arenaria]